MKKLTKTKIKDLVEKYGAYIDFEKYEILLRPQNGKDFVYSFCKYSDNFGEVWEMIERYDWKVRFDKDDEFVSII